MRNVLRSNSRTRRLTARGMLIVWLFTLASGAVNACVQEARGGHSQDHGAPAVHLSATGVELETAPGHAAGTARDEHDTGAESTNKSCLKACDAGSQSLLKQPSSLDSPHLERAPFAVTVWAAESDDSTLVDRAHDLQIPRTRAARQSSVLATGLVGRCLRRSRSLSLCNSRLPFRWA